MYVHLIWDILSGGEIAFNRKTPGHELIEHKYMIREQSTLSEPWINYDGIICFIDNRKKTGC